MVPPSAGELDRVREQVEEDLTDLALVGDHGSEVGRDIRRERDGMGRRPLADEAERPADRVGQGELARLEVHPAGLDLRQVEDVVDQREEVLARGFDVLEVIGLLVASARRTSAAGGPLRSR